MARSSISCEFGPPLVFIFKIKIFSAFDTCHQHTMAIAPITGKLRRRLITDLSVAMGLGVSGGYLFWYGYRLPSVKRREDFYLKYENERRAKLAGNA